jgi:two-component system response regulator TctD
VLATTRYVAVVLDLGFPDDDGLAVLGELRRRADATPVLVLTARGGVHDRVTGLRGGADDYLTKPFAMEELVARLHALLRRPGDLLSRSLRLGNVSFDTETRQVFVAEKPQLFSAREVAVLEILLRRGGRVVTKKLVEDQLFGLSIDVGSNAIEVYVHRLRKQLADSGASVQIHTIRGVGYLIAEEKPR